MARIGYVSNLRGQESIILMCVTKFINEKMHFKFMI